MSAIEWSLVVIAFGLTIIVWQLMKIGSHLSRLVVTLTSLDSEVFHLAQEQNPNYGQCDNCGRRAIVRHVLPSDTESSAEDSEMFYCQACWWMSDSVRVSDEGKHYKDRPSERDRFAATVGPGKP